MIYKDCINKNPEKKATIAYNSLLFLPLSV
jgi:hypothetical protein